MLALLLALAGCGGREVVDVPDEPAFAGFDTWRYPGEPAMRAWREASPFRWVGYYLPAPCHRDESWSGRRAALERQGWGLAVLYVGQQTWEGQQLESAESSPRCSRALLSAERGRAEARDAVVRTAAEGFAAGTVIFLDVERMTRFPPEWIAYYQAWTDEVLRDGRFRAGTYAHRRNATALLTMAQAAYDRLGRTDEPPFWVAGGSGFTLQSHPARSGVPFADVWQGRLDVDRSYGGVTLRIDENTARSPSPSRP